MRLDPDDGARADLRAARVMCMLARKRVDEWEFFPDTLPRPVERRMSAEQIAQNARAWLMALGAKLN